MKYWGTFRYQRWIIWGILAVVFLLVSLYRLSSAVLADRLMVAFDTSGVALGTLHAAFFYVYALMQLPAGVLADRTGPRKTATAGAIVLNVGAVGFALADSYVVAFLARALVGLGGAVIYISILRFCASWFRADEFATMNGLTVAVSGLGGILATTPLAVAAGTFGWRGTTLALGAFGLALAVVVFVLADDEPEDAGFEPVTETDTTSLTLADVVENLRVVLSERVTWAISLMLFCSTGMLITLLGLWGVPYVVQTYGVSVTTASWYTLLGSLGLLFGPPAFGWLSDRLERRTVLVVVGGVGYVAGFGILAVAGQPPRIVVGVVYFAMGFLLGAFTLSYAVIKERHATSASGVSTSTINGAAFLGAALFPTLLGYVLDAYWTGEMVAGARIYTEVGYQVSFAIATVASAVALACSLWLYRQDPTA
ncbi:MFS transporter [Natrialbaceae archaeon AArc-T1-2]|uniref:MFS transporter n=1 Tax=Natrialbaceae archaeon AArc-T1-2 TaxID=3053904 RepID=UPI00255A9216|nr:MFS transporter [Natrialbaceae archaeon AArc-T1-2]WIV66975.1 MFS transporter [Natrialbaceae archaeon AArc-T1-2]